MWRAVAKAAADLPPLHGNVPGNLLWALRPSLVSLRDTPPHPWMPQPAVRLLRTVVNVAD